MITAKQMLLDGSAEEMPHHEEHSLPRYLEISAVEGGLMIPAQAAIVLKLSKQRVSQLVQSGRLRSLSVLGQTMISARDVEAFLRSERKPGRPKKLVAA